MSKVSITVSVTVSSLSYRMFTEDLLHIKHSSKHSISLPFAILIETLWRFQLHKDIYKIPAANIILHDYKLDAFLLRSSTKQEYPISALLFLTEILC